MDSGDLFRSTRQMFPSSNPIPPPLNLDADQYHSFSSRYGGYFDHEFTNYTSNNLLYPPSGDNSVFPPPPVNNGGIRINAPLQNNGQNHAASNGVVPYDTAPQNVANESGYNFPIGAYDQMTYRDMYPTIYGFQASNSTAYVNALAAEMSLVNLERNSQSSRRVNQLRSQSTIVQNENRNPINNFGAIDPVFGTRRADRPFDFNALDEICDLYSNDGAGYFPHRLSGGDSVDYNQYVDSRRFNGDARDSRVTPFNRSVGRQNHFDERPRRSLARHSINEMRGNIALMAEDQSGCRVLQNKVDEGNRDDIQAIYMEIKDDICNLMTHQFGNYLTQKLFEVCNRQQMDELLSMVLDDELKFSFICCDNFGTRSVQKLLDEITTYEQKRRFLSIIPRVAVNLMNNINGHHIIYCCLRIYTYEENKDMMSVIAENCVGIAVDRSGCCSLQPCFDYSTGEQRQRIIADITTNALMLSQNPFGNYVVQYIIGREVELVSGDIMNKLDGSFVLLSMNKYGSNVVEKCLRRFSETHKRLIIEELIRSAKFGELLLDPYGNYVAQCALSVCMDGLLHGSLVSMIRRNSPKLHSHPHGKRVLEKIVKGNRQMSYW